MFRDLGGHGRRRRDPGGRRDHRRLCGGRPGRWRDRAESSRFLLHLRAPAGRFHLHHRWPARPLQRRAFRRLLVVLARRPGRQLVLQHRRGRGLRPGPGLGRGLVVRRRVGTGDQPRGRRRSPAQHRAPDYHPGGDHPPPDHPALLGPPDHTPPDHPAPDHPAPDHRYRRVSTTNSAGRDHRTGGSDSHGEVDLSAHQPVEDAAERRTRPDPSADHPAAHRPTHQQPGFDQPGRSRQHTEYTESDRCADQVDW